MADRCAGVTNAGAACTRPALTGERYCLMHSPAHAALRKEAARKGGAARSNKARAKAAIPDALSADELAGYLSLVFKQTIAGRVEPKLATAVATLARAITEIRDAADLAEMRAELDALQAERKRRDRAA